MVYAINYLILQIMIEVDLQLHLLNERLLRILQVVK